MMSSIRGLRTATTFLLTIVVVACGGDDAIIVPDALGMRVVFVADGENSVGIFNVRAADTGSTTQQTTTISRGIGAADVVNDPIMSPDGRYLGAKISAAGGCPSRYEFVDTMTGSLVNMLRGTSDCVHEIRFNPAGGNLALRVTLAGEAGPRLALADKPDTNTIYSIDSGVTTGTVSAFRFAGDGSTIAWTEANGLYSSTTFTVGSFGQIRSADTPVDFAVTRDGAVAVYVAPGEQRFRKTAITPGAPLSETYLTAALAPGDTLGAFALSPDGAQLLYLAYVGGVPQLWLVPVAGPLTEQRVDGAAPLSFGLIGLKFAWNTDGTRFAWFGGASNRVFAATLAAPTTAVALSRASEHPHSQLVWSDATTVIYDANDSTFIALLSVDATAPLGSVLLNHADDLFDTGVDAFVVCADGTVIYRYTRFTLSSTDSTTALFSTQPMVPISARRITPYYPQPPSGFGARMVCER